MTLDPYDLYDVRSLLSEEERAVQDTVARLVEPSGFRVHTTVTGLGEVSWDALGNVISFM